MAGPIWIKLRVNPEPWAVGTITRVKGGARLSPDPNLVAFQRAVREELENEKMLPDDYRKITFYFFRQRVQYLDNRDKVRTRNQADATNMQKALEDALQGILFANDREVRDIRSVIVDQGVDVTPMILIKAEPIDEATFKHKALLDAPMNFIKDFLLGKKPEPEAPASNTWGDGEDLF